MGRTQLNCRLNEGQKERWEAHVEESRYDDSVTDLVKRAVENQIDRDNGDAPTSNGDSEANERVDKVLTAVEDNAARLTDLEEQLTDIREIAASGGAVADDTVGDAFAALPSDVDSRGQGAMKGKTPSEVAEDIDVDAEEAEIALNQLRRDTGTVGMLMTQDSDEPVYWRKE